jgi:5-methylcytosine-specific restriction endonuclease McrA
MARYRPPGTKRPFKIVAKIRRTKKQTYGEDWSKTSKAIKQRDGKRCTKCGTTEGPFHTHHLIRVGMGGQTLPINMCTLCENCHKRQPGHTHMHKAKRKSKR